MAILSQEGYVHGMPRIKGRRLWVSHVVANVEDRGIFEYHLDFKVKFRDIIDAIEYCRNEKCLDGALNFCYGCKKNKEDENCVNVSEIALTIHKKNKNLIWILDKLLRERN